MYFTSFDKGKHGDVMRLVLLNAKRAGLTRSDT